MSERPGGEAARVDTRRLVARLAELAGYTDTPGAGVTRLAYSARDVAARDLVAGWMVEAGLRPEVDAAGNLIGWRAGHAGLSGILACGSHLDTVLNAGALDGAYGVVAAVEVAAALHAAGVALRHDLAVVAFSNEEGARGTPGMVGSLAITGQLTAAQLAEPDDEGVPLAERIRAVGGDPDAIASAAWPSGRLAGFLELHIEQGPVLDAAGASIAVVSGITGRATVDLLVTGVANHAGSTPMAARRDAAHAAALLILAVRELTGDAGVRVATTGALVLEPGVRNVVPGRARIGVDLRDLSDARIATALERLRAEATRIGAVTGTVVEVLPRSAVPAVPADSRLAGCVRAAATGYGLAPLELPSGAGHDAQVMAALGPVGMVFTPSIGGISHAPEETTDPDDLATGAQVLCRALLLADSLSTSDGLAGADRPAGGWSRMNTVDVA
jgi:N-carbamoyl-L-amino-acid hydrolase